MSRGLSIGDLQAKPVVSHIDIESNDECFGNIIQITQETLQISNKISINNNGLDTLDFHIRRIAALMDHPMSKNVGEFLKAGEYEIALCELAAEIDEKYMSKRG